MRIVIDDGRDQLELPVPEHLAEELLRRSLVACSKLGPERLGELFLDRLLTFLIDLTVVDARPPSAAQLKFALDISRRLGIPLPPEAVKERGAMGLFLTTYGDRLRHSGKGDAGSQGALRPAGEIGPVVE